ncbi:MAG TPA: hypothetical protein VHT29_04085 [Solirubrobacteraceae bacterium]|nr:hypothetical protein [Solirubrobacteraceae bacterium]
MLHLPKLARALVLALVAAAALAPGASASHSQTSFFESPALLRNPATRPGTIATLQRLGVRALRVELSWHNVAPAANSAHRPSFDATNPAAYAWSEYDPEIQEAHERGWQVLLTVTSPVPRWATGNPHGRSLLFRPSASQFQAFMTAVGRHYGSVVSLFSIWNEPNHHEFLEPQFNTNGTPASPSIYRALYTAGYAGLKAAGLPSPRVLIGETAPEGESSPSVPVRGPNHNLSPIAFLRGVLCLDSSYHRAHACGMLQASGWGLHPYASIQGPLYTPKSRESVTIGVLSRMTSALDRAARAGALPNGLPLYITEFGVISQPARYIGQPVAKQAEYDAIAERIAYSNPRVASFSQYLLRDDKARGGYAVAFTTGLEYSNGKAKPLLAAFPVTLTVSRHGSAYALWGYVRPAGQATTLTVEAERRGSHRFKPLAQVNTDARGYWTLSSTVAATRWRVRWVSPEGTTYTGAPIRAY